MVNLVAARTMLIPCNTQVDTLPRGPSGQQYSNPLAVNRCVKRCPILWTLNLGCAQSLAKKQASEGTPFNDDDHVKRIMDYDLRVCTWNIGTLNTDGASAQLAEDLIECGPDITAIQEMR